MARLDGKVAFVTGLGRGQGRSHAVRLAEEGADIVGIDALEPYDTIPYAMATPADLDETVAAVERLDRRIVTRKADVRDRDQVRAAVNDGVAELGRLDIVAASAGISPPGAPLWEIPPQEWHDVIAVNLTGVFHTLACTVPVMLEAGNGGSIVITSSGAGIASVPNLSDYVATKFAVVGMGRSLAKEVARHGIRVNVICPGTVNTPMLTENEGTFRVFRPDLEQPTLDDARPVFVGMNPMGQPWVEPVDISNLIVFLSSDEARYITGTVIPVDQGSVA